jgi:hypothetical protein
MPSAVSPPTDAARAPHVASAGRQPILASEVSMQPCAGPDRCIIAAGWILALALSLCSLDSHHPASSSLPTRVEGECPATGTPEKARLPLSCALTADAACHYPRHHRQTETLRVADITHITARWSKPRNGRLARPPFFDDTSRAATFGRQTASCAAPSFALDATGLAARWSYLASRSLGGFQS